MEETQATPQSQGLVEGLPAQAAPDLEDHYYNEDGSHTRRGVMARRKAPVWQRVLRVVVSLVLMALCIFAVLWVVSIAALYDSIPAMLRDMGAAFAGAWQRLIG